MSARILSEITVLNANRKARREAVRFGFPLKKGLTNSAHLISVYSLDGIRQDTQITPINYWFDKSLKWVSVVLIVQFTGHADIVFRVCLENESHRRAIFDSGQPVNSLKPAPMEKDLLQFFVPESVSSIILRDSKGTALPFCISDFSLESGKLLNEVEYTFQPILPKYRKVLLKCRITNILAINRVKLDFTLWNTRRAIHEKGLWDLGDGNSFYFKSLQFKLDMQRCEPIKKYWKIDLLDGETLNGEGDFRAFQNSSGGENWNSRNHVNCDNRITCWRKECFYKSEKISGEVTRGQPRIRIESGRLNISAALTQFWQRFPSEIRLSENCMVFGLLPETGDFLHELQPGERLSRTVVLSFEETNEIRTGQYCSLSAASVMIKPKYIAESGCIHCFATPGQTNLFKDLTAACLEGKNSFYQKREAVDEYGWRNFGDVYADHEEQYYKGEDRLVSHYNNQYDLLFGFLIQFLQKSEPRWFELAEDLAEHIVNIDIYNTSEDRAVFNNGMFWHTDHYAHAKTATHRSYSKRHALAVQGKPYGGGPANEHHYTSGLLLMYFLSGDKKFKEAVLKLADCVISRDDGSKTLLSFLDNGPTGYSSMTRAPDYHFPGRGCANSINALMDAYQLTGSAHYLAFAETLIERSVNPGMDIGEIGLENIELTWSYLVFLQVLGKYLMAKYQSRQLDKRFWFCRDSLLLFAGWMKKNERPFKQQFHKTEFPTETWVAHDMRKSNVFDYAAFFAEPSQRRNFKMEGEKYYNSCLRDIQEFSTWHNARPMAILLSSEYIHHFFDGNLAIEITDFNHSFEFAPYQKFITQKERAKLLLKTPKGILKTIFQLFKPSFLYCLFNKKY